MRWIVPILLGLLSLQPVAGALAQERPTEEASPTEEPPDRQRVPDAPPPEPSDGPELSGGEAGPQPDATPESATVAPPSPTATLLLAINVDGAEVRVNGDRVGEAPLAPLVLAPGTHRVEVAAPGFRPFEGTVSVEADAHIRRNVDLVATGDTLVDLESARAAAPDADPWYTRWYVLGGAGVVTAALVVTALVVATTDEDPSGIPVPPIE